MSHEKVGAIRTNGNTLTSCITYSRKQRGITLPYDTMTKEERDALNGPVKTYFDKGLIKDEHTSIRKKT